MRMAVHGVGVGTLVVLLLGTIAPAQRGDPEEFLRLEPVLRTALDKVAPSVVTIETFGGTRKILVDGPGVPSDGPGGKPPAPPKKNDEKDPEKKPDEEKKGEQDPDKKGDEKKDEKKDEKIGPIKQPGFLQAQGATSGIVLTSDGWICLSRFALNFDPTTILVTLPDGRSFHATRGGEDTSRGIALVKIDVEGLPVPDLASVDKARVGQWAFVMGRTFGRADPSVHMGIVSATGRLFGRALQTDAYTSPANYGGPLIDIEGRVLGISVPLSRSGRDAGAELYDSGIGFATTLVGIEPLLERMKSGEVLHRGWFGVITAPEHLGPGAVLNQVLEDSPAAKAGLKKDDLIVRIDGTPVRNSFHLQTLVSSKMGGDEISLQIGRGSEQTELTIALADLPEQQRKSKKPDEEAGVLPWEKGEPKEPGR